MMVVRLRLKTGTYFQRPNFQGYNAGVNYHARYISSTREENSGPIRRIDRNEACEENNGLAERCNDGDAFKIEGRCVYSVFQSFLKL
jgi:hypothetical protein